jgi:hypothetical protein
MHSSEAQTAPVSLPMKWLRGSDSRALPLGIFRSAVGPFGSGAFGG